MSDLISRQAAIDAFERFIHELGIKDEPYNYGEMALSVQNILSVEPEECGDVGEISDGYHTFNQLYHQRAILFAAIVNQNKGISWKSYKHSDGKYCFDSDGEWFVVGIDTPKGSYTYHYSKEYWDYFECKELDCGKEWDGHTEDDVIRLLSLASVEPERKTGKWIQQNNKSKKLYGWFFCSECNAWIAEPTNYCSECGAEMEGKDGSCNDNTI